MTQKYWKLVKPTWEYDTDDPNDYLQYEFRNGFGGMPYSIPGMLCPNCKDWSLACEFPFSCPQELKEHPYIGGGPISIKQHHELTRYAEYVFEKNGIFFDEHTMDRRLWLSPGADFMDVSLKIACHPAFSFLWCFSTTRPVTQKKVKDAFERHGLTGVTFHQVKMLHVGKANYDEWEPNTVIPGSYDDEEFFVHPPRVIEPEDNPESFGPLYYFRVSHWGPDWTDPTESKRCCKLCGKPFRKRKPKKVAFTEKHLLPNYDVFRSPVSGSIVLSDKAYQIFQDLKFTNAPLNELEITR